MCGELFVAISLVAVHFLSPAAAWSGDVVQLHIAANGSDTNAGTPGNPLASLEAARDTIRRLKKNGPASKGYTVWIHQGIYARTETFELTADDAGTAAAPVVYRAAEGEQVRVIGGRELRRDWFGPVDDPEVLAALAEPVRGSVLQVDLKSHGISDLGAPGLEGGLELFLGARRMQLARWPNSGWALATRADPAPDASGAKRFHFQWQGAGPRHWRRLEEVLLHGYWRYDYQDGVVRLAQIDVEKQLVELVEDPGDGEAGPRRFYALNLLEELDEPGEWYLDRSRALLYLLPPQNFSEDRVFVSLFAGPLVRLRDTASTTLRGLTLEIVRGQAVVVEGGKNNRIAGCTIRNTGGDALVFQGGESNGVVGCDIYDVGSGGVTLVGGDRSKLIPARLYALNNHIHHYARLGRSYRPAVRLDGVGQHVAHNLIHHAPHAAILYSGNDHVMELNEIHHVVLDSSDAGVLYSGYDWTFRGNVVRHNFFHHIPHLPGGYTRVVYLDDAHSSTQTFGNVFYQTHQAVWIGGGRDNAVENNIFIECDEPVGIDNRGLRWTFLNPDGDIKETGMYAKLTAFDYQHPPWSERYPQLARILDQHPRAPLGNTLKRNVSVRSHWRDPEKHCRESSPRHIDQKYMEIADNYVTDEDPGFIDAANRNFQLADDSVVYTKIRGFHKIPFDQIGLRRDEYRAGLPDVGDDQAVHGLEESR